MLSLVELRRAARILDSRLAGSTLHRVIQPDSYSLVLVCHGEGRSDIVLLSCSPEHARLCDLQEVPAPPAAIPSFCQYLRAHLQRGVLEKIDVPFEDRLAFIRLSARDGAYELVLSILGPRSNVYLLDSERRVLHSMRPLEETRKELSLGTPWANPVGRLRSAGADRWEGVSDEEYPGAVDLAYRRLEKVHEAEAQARLIDTALRKQEEYLSRKASNLSEDLAEAQQAEDLRRRGELLKSVLHRVPVGTESVTAEDFATGERVVIALDPRLSPADNLEALFRRYQKVSRGREHIEGQLADVRLSLEEILELREALRRTMSALQVDPGRIEDIATLPKVRRLLHRKAAPAAAKVTAPKPGVGKREVPAKLLPKRYRAEHGLEIWVGKSDDGNDYLTTRLAHGNDLFFHLEGYPGSHVVLRTGGRKDPPPEAVLDACELAVHFSKLKDATRADVHVARIKDVKKPKGAKPGLVYVSRGRTIHLRRSPRRLENVLASRLD